MPKKSSRRKIAQEAKRELSRERKKLEALRLRIHGKTLREIAAELGYRGPSEAFAAIREARGKVPKEDVAEIRTLMAERLEVAFAAMMPDVEKGDLKSIDRLVKVAARTAKLLGLDLQAGAPPEVPVGRLRVGRPDDGSAGAD